MPDRITQHPSVDDRRKPRLLLIPTAHLQSEIVPDTFFLFSHYRHRALTRQGPEWLHRPSIYIATARPNRGGQP